MSTVYYTNAAEITSIANAIRSKAGISASLSYPDGFIAAISSISGGGGTINNQNKSVSPSTTAFSVTYDTGYTGLGTVTVNAIPMAGVAQFGGYVEFTPSISVDSSGLITTSFQNTTDFYATPVYSDGWFTSAMSDNISVSMSATYQLSTKSASTITPTTASQIAVASHYYTTGNIVVDAIPSAYIIPSGTLSISANGTGINVTQYASVDVSVPTGGATLQSKSVSFTPAETLQTSSVTADVGYDGLSKVDITVSAVPSTYVGTGITRYSSADLTVSANTVTAPAGYYENDASKSVATMTLPTATSGSATTGYTSKATISRSTSDQYINIPPGYNASGAYYKFSAIANGSATGPSSVSSTGATVSTGTNTLTLTKTGVSTTPTVSAGYVASATSSTATVSLTASVTTKGTATITPTTTNQTISSGTYITGTQTISGDANLVASNIKNGVPIFGVTGTYTGGGGVTGVAKGTLTVASNVNTSTNTKITDTSTIGFTPKAFMFYRSDRSATSNHVNYATFVTLGSSYYVRSRTRYSSNALSTSGDTNNWTTQSSGYLYFNNNNVYFRSSSSYILASGTWNWVAIQ